MKIHMVKSGDTMYNIAQKYGVTLEQLIAFNPQISNPEQIDVGMKVKIPSAAIHDGSPSMEYAHKHVVVQGDSLWKISKAWGLPLKALVDANPQLKNPSVLLTGEIVYIPKEGSMVNTGTNMGTSHTMNVNSAVSQATNMPNMANSLSPAYTPLPIAPQQPNIAPLPIAPQQPNVAAQPIEVAPTPKPIEVAPTPKPIEHKIHSESNKPIFEKTNDTNMNILPVESTKDMMNVYSSESLFMQYDVPAVEASGNVNYPPPAYQMPTWNSNEMPQWEPTNNNAAPINTFPEYAEKPDCGCGCGGKSNAMPYNANEMPQWEPTNNYAAPINTFPEYAEKPDCGCGCGGKSNAMPYNANEMPYNANAMPYNMNEMPYNANAMPYNMNEMPYNASAMPYNMNEMPYNANAMPYNMNEMPFSTNAMPYNMNEMPFNTSAMPYNMNGMPDNSYPAANSTMPSYYVPQPMLAYSTQPQSQQSPMQFPFPASETSPYGQMMPCYPMGNYGDMGYLHGMQTPYSPWASSNEAPVQNFADNSNSPAAFNDQMSGVLGTTTDDGASKKQVKIPRKPTARTQQKQSSRTVLHEFLQKKSGQGNSIRENKINEPWMNR